MASSIDSLRQSLRFRRRQLGLGVQIAAARRLVETVISLDYYKTSSCIACYLPNDGELDCRELIKQIWRDNKHCYLPVLAQNRNGPSLLFTHYGPGSSLKKNCYQIPEPFRGIQQPVDAMDLVIVPLVGFDDQGNRIGMGGGYYDRTFADQENESMPWLLGVAHRCQQVSELNSQPWDVGMDMVVSV